MKHTLYKTQGTCSQFIDVTVDDDGIIQQVSFYGGCHGNLQGICRLITGQKIDDVIPKLNDIRGGDKATSYPDQLCRALKQLKRNSYTYFISSSKKVIKKADRSQPDWC